MRSSAPLFVRIPIPRLRRKLVLFICSLLLTAGVFSVKTAFFPAPPTASAQVSCANRAASFMFLIDRSGSMGEGTKLADARNATISFINRLSTYTTNPVSYAGAISIANSYEAVPQDPLPWTKLEWRLTQWYSNVIQAVNKLTTVGGATCISCAIKLANEQFATYSSDGSRKNVVIVITDGGATRTLGGVQDSSDAWDEALQYANDSVARYNTTFFVINIDPNTGSYDLRRMNDLAAANKNQPGRYFFKSSSDIDAALDEIFKIYGTASITGYKYNDVNRNTTFDKSSESGISNWKIDLKQSGQPTRTATTDASGQYRFDEVCNGDYVLSEQKQAGWDLINPANNALPVSIRDLNSVSDRNFGNAVALKYSFSGLIFIDANGDGRFQFGEELYKGDQKINWVNQDTLQSNSTSTQTGTYAQVDLPAGRYLVEYDQAWLPDNFSIFPKPPKFLITIGPGCDFPDSTAPDAICSQNNITGLNFALQNSSPWYQDEALDMRFDNGAVDSVPLTAAACPGGPNASTVGRGGSPGVIFSGDQPYSFAPGSSSVRKWVAGGPNFKEKFRGTGPLQTSYQSLPNTIKKSGTVIQPLDTTKCGGSYAACTLTGNFDGPYSVDGDLVLNGATISSGRKIVLLVSGNVTIKGAITTPVGSYFLISAGGNIDVEPGFGSTPSCTPTPQLQGIFVTDYTFTAKTGADCPSSADAMLTIGGTVVVNASRSDTGEHFINKRTLCDGNLRYPSLRVAERSDFALNAPDYISPRSVIWKEVAP